ncbi:ammonium transporter [Halofilum ochraceum]|uniref:ammonium transporter n=1 Tax=Halofilum ochraceum TaxID=1611323 RepID=UPI000829AB6E
MDTANMTIELSYALDTFYFLVCGALVMWMAAGFAMLESGLVRSKNTAEILTKNVALYSIACVMYLLLGYQVMYGGDGINGVIPSLGALLPGENTTEAVLAGGEGAPYYSGASDFFFQVVFVAATMSIISGAVAERMKLWSFLTFAVFMTAIIYPVQAYWSWGGGFLSAAGYSDFAGSGIVHLCGGVGALIGAIMVGPRKGKYDAEGRPRAIPGANMPLAALGMFALWLGWFGFNGGSQLVLSSVADANAVAKIFVNTNTAAAGGLLAALITARIKWGKADLTMAVNGALAGLVAITAEPLAPSPLAATLIGAVGGIIVVFSVLALDRLRVDDPVGAISVHGTAGIWGVLIVPASNTGASIGPQLLGLAAIIGWTAAASAVVFALVKLGMGLRVTEEEEYEGVDIAECGLEAYPEFVGARGGTAG